MLLSAEELRKPHDVEFDAGCHFDAACAAYNDIPKKLTQRIAWEPSNHLLVLEQGARK